MLYEGPDADIVHDALRTLTERGHVETATQLGYIIDATDRRRSRASRHKTGTAVLDV